MKRIAVIAVAHCLLLALAACRDQQSVLAPQGPDAARLTTLSWILFAGGIVILVGVIAVAAAAMYGSPRVRRTLARQEAIVGGGMIFPIVTLTALLAYGLGVTRAGMVVATDREPLRIAVIGERWWWRVIYSTADGERLETANELRVPIGRRIEIELESADVIHSFWVPALAGKVDMIPGRKTRLTFAADRPGISRGQCAEYCGGAHALMAFQVIALEPAKFEAWLDRQKQTARTPVSSEEQRGLAVFQANGCGGCHTIRETPAKGTIGPDLTHVGSRMMLGAATLPNSSEHLKRWIKDSQRIKPDNLMLTYRSIPDSELTALTSYLTSLK